MTHSPAETIFDFHVAEIGPERVQAWQERVEFLLDESAAGAASFQATDEEVLREQSSGEAGLRLSSARLSTARPSTARPSTADERERQSNGFAGDGVSDAEMAARRSAMGEETISEETISEETVAARKIGSNGSHNGIGRLHADINGLLNVEPDQIRLFPDAELPGIGNRGRTSAPLSAPVPPPAYAQPVQEAPTSRFVDAGEQSRYLHTPSNNPPPEAVSLLTRPAPALGKIPPPATPTVSLTAGQIRFLDEEIAQLYDEVKRVLAARREITGHALSLLREAREIVLTEPHRLGRAEYNLNQVRAILERTQDSRRQSSQRGFRVLLFLSLWLAGTVGAGVALFLYGAELTRVANALLGSQSQVTAHLHPFLWTLVAGSTGAVVGTILGFLTHIRSENDFDRQHVVRFAVQPMMGVVLGVLLYTFFSLLFLSMQIDLTARSITRALPVVLALPAGLWQEWIYASLYRMMGFFTLRPRRR